MFNRTRLSIKSNARAQSVPSCVQTHIRAHHQLHHPNLRTHRHPPGKEGQCEEGCPRPRPASQRGALRHGQEVCVCVCLCAYTRVSMRMCVDADALCACVMVSLRACICARSEHMCAYACMHAYMCLCASNQRACAHPRVPVVRMQSSDCTHVSRRALASFLIEPCRTDVSKAPLIRLSLAHHSFTPQANPTDTGLARWHSGRSGSTRNRRTC